MQHAMHAATGSGPADTADILIIGGGASGVLLTLQLRGVGAEAPSTILVDPQPGRGRAYAAGSPLHVLNVPAGRMSALADVPDDFVRWGRQRGIPIEPSEFVPRGLYGEYLRSRLDDALSGAAGRVRVERARAHDLWQGAGGRWIARLADGRTLAARRVVLALGHFPPSDPAALHDRPARYIADPWCDAGRAARDAIGLDEPVVFIGSGLTMYDMAIELAARGHTGPMHAVSRRGLLPQPHRHLDEPPRGLPAPSVRYWPTSAAGLLRAVRLYVRRCAIEGADWREAVTALRPVTGELFASMPPRERARFLARVQPYWETHRHRAAPRADEAVRHLRESGRLTVHAARVLGVAAVENGEALDVRLRPRGEDDARTLRVGWVINCTGPRGDVTTVDDPLVRSMLQRGLLIPDPLRLGVLATPDGRVLTRDDAGEPAVCESLSCIGPMRRAQLWETTAIPEIRVQTGLLARTLTTDRSAPGPHAIAALRSACS